VRGFGVESGELSVVDEQSGGGDHPASAPGGRDTPRPERDELLAEVRRLEAELERYRTHAERTSKLFLSSTKYAERVRENARRDAELALRKASARVERLKLTASELEWTESELVRRQDELARLQALTDETRTRLSAFLTAGLRALSTEVGPGDEDGTKPELGDLQDTLHRQLASTSAPASAGPLGELEIQER